MAKAKFENEYTYRRFAESGKEEEFDRLFGAAASEARQAFGKTYPMHIGGKEVTAEATIEERSPVDGSIIGRFQRGTKVHAREAIETAHAAQPSWAETPYPERAGIFRKIADVFVKHKFELAAILSYENAKSRYESVGEIDEAIDFMRYYAGELEANRGYSRRSAIKGSTVGVSSGFQGAPSTSMEKITVHLAPYGVFGVVAPFNFPVSISTGMSVGAMITGNTVVFKPSSTDNPAMLTGLKLYELFKEGGLPAGVFNYVSGPGSEVGDELVTNRDVAGIAFTGSRTTGIGMVAKAYSMGMQKTFVVEMGGKNPAIVSKSADLDDAVSGIASAAFGFAGQKCSACSRVYVHESVKELFVSKMIEKMRSLKIGNPLEKETYIGPLISEKAYRTYSEAVGKARSTGRVLFGGNRVDNGLSGFYVEPTLIEVRHDNELTKRELFVPILTLETFKDFTEALKMANDVEYGLTAGLYSKRKAEIDEFSKGIQSGVVYINRPSSATTGAIVGMHTFVGWKGSSINGKGTGSTHYLPQFMREQSVSLTK